MAPYAVVAPLPSGAPLPKYRNNDMRVAGIVLTSLASATLLAGITVTAVDLAKPLSPYSDVSYKGMATVLVGLPLMAGSTVLAGIGIPLWKLGAAPPRAVPSVGVGPGSTTLRWTF